MSRRPQRAEPEPSPSRARACPVPLLVSHSGRWSVRLRKPCKPHAFSGEDSAGGECLVAEPSSGRVTHPAPRLLSTSSAAEASTVCSPSCRVLSSISSFCSVLLQNTRLRCTVSPEAFSTPHSRVRSGDERPIDGLLDLLSFRWPFQQQDPCLDAASTGSRRCTGGSSRVAKCGPSASF